MEKMDSVRLEIIRLRAQLLPQEELTQAEKREVKAAEKEFSASKTTSLKAFLRQIGE